LGAVWLPQELSNTRELITDQRNFNGNSSFREIDKLSKRTYFYVKSVMVSQYLHLKFTGGNVANKNKSYNVDLASNQHERDLVTSHFTIVIRIYPWRNPVDPTYMYVDC
jgi:hypothetical protein